MKDFFKASIRTAGAIFLALLGLAIAIGVYSWAKDSYDRQQARPFEDVREWKFDLKDSIGIQTQAKTKLVAGTLIASVEVIGHPRYFSDPRNTNASLIFDFLDTDGFKVISKPVRLLDFTTVVGNNGEKTGLVFQFEEFTGLEKYKRISRMQVGWNLITEPAAQLPAQALILDHCAPDISNAERLKRLAQYGNVRETGLGSYSAAGHSLHFLLNGSLLGCQ